MPDVDDRIVGVVVAFLTTLWTWVVFSATVSVFSGERAVRAILGPNSPPSMREQVSQQIPGYVETFVTTLTFGDRQSWVIRPGESSRALVGEFGGRTLKLLTVALVLALVVAVPLVVVSQVDIARPFVAAFGLLGGVPALVWSLFVLDFAANPGSHIAPRSLDELLVPGATLAVPLGLAVARIASRVDATDVRTTVRDVLLDGWLFVVWIPGALVVVEAIFAVNGVSYLWFQALLQSDFPLFTLLSSVLVAPVVFCAFLRELGLALTLPEATPSPSRRSVAADGGAASTTTPFHTAFSSGGVALVGGGLFGLLFLIGLVGSQLTSRSGFAAPSRNIETYQILDALAVTTSTAVLALVVATLVGVGLGVLGTRTPMPRQLNRVFDPLANLPFAVFLLAWLAYLEFPEGMTARVVVGSLGGLAIAPMVARRFEREAGDGSVETALLSSLGLATTGAALVVFVTAEFGFLGGGLRDLAFSFGQYRLESLFWSHLAFVALPAIALLLLGERLRRYESA